MLQASSARRSVAILDITTPGQSSVSPLFSSDASLRLGGPLTRVEVSRFGLGNVYLKTGKTTLAEYHFRKALQLNPSNATIACCVGAVLEKLGRRAEALDMYDEAKAVAPESSLVRFKRVRLLVRMQRHEVGTCFITSRASIRS